MLLRAPPAACPFGSHVTTTRGTVEPRGGRHGERSRRKRSAARLNQQPAEPPDMPIDSRVYVSLSSAP
jgi:hypothetical protein